jgi:hypothetical protein
MAIIDFRIRPPHKSFLASAMYANAARRDGITRKIGFEPSQAAAQLSTAMLIAEMDAAGVVVGRKSDTLGSIENADILELAMLHPGRFVPVGSVLPLPRLAARGEIDRLVAQGFKAIAIEPGGLAEPLHYDDRRLYPFYADCEDRGLPLIVMGGGNAGPDITFTAPERLDRVLGDFPKLRIVSAHGSWPWVHQILHVAFRRSNLYLSPDYLMANMPGMDDYIRAADTYLSEQFLYASAFPFAPVKAYADWFRSLPIRPENLERVMYRNAKKLLG